MKITGYPVLEKPQESNKVRIIKTDSELLIECAAYCWTIPNRAFLSADFLTADEWLKRDYDDCPDAPPIDDSLIRGFAMVEIGFVLSKTDLFYRLPAAENAFRPECCPTDADALLGYKTEDIDAAREIVAQLCTMLSEK